jgi:DNA-binding IclR family transcriptional regulator
VVLGYLEYDLETRAYFPTMRMPSITNWIEKARFGNGSVLAAMARLHEATSETVTLGLQSDLHAQYVYQIATSAAVPYPRTRQTVRPLAKSGMGWLLLSAMSDADIDHLVRRINHARRKSQERVDLGELMLKVAEIRRAGYVFSRHTVVQGAGMIGMLIKNPKSGRQLALSVHAPVERLEARQDMIVRELAAVCAAVSALDS